MLFESKNISTIQGVINNEKIIFIQVLDVNI